MPQTPASPDPGITISVNGKPQQLPEGSTLAGLIERMGLAGTACAAEVNRRLVPKREHQAATLAEGDTVELVTLVGGG